MIALRYNFYVLATLILSISSSLAAPADADLSSTKCKAALKTQKAFCVKWLNGVHPAAAATVTATVTAQAGATITQTITKPTISIVTQTVNQDTTVTQNHPVTVTDDDVQTIFDTVTSTKNVITTATGFPSSLHQRDVDAKIKISVKKPKSVKKCTNKVITQGCLNVVYGLAQYPTVTSTSTVIKGTALSTVQVPVYSTSLSTVTVTNVATHTVTNEVTATQKAEPITLTNTALATSTITNLVAPTVIPSPGEVCNLVGKTYTCTWSPTDGTGLQSLFTAPCDGLMSVQLKGAGGGNSMQNGGAAPGHAVQSQIPFSSSSDIIPALTQYSIYVGGFGAAQGNGGAGGFNGGGAGALNGAGGGGATDIRYMGTRLAVAAGGGGNGNLAPTITANPGYGDADTIKSRTSNPIGAIGTLLGAGGGGGGLLGGAAGRLPGYGGISGTDLGTPIDLDTIGNMPKAVVTYVCSA